jgi:hypothetical protein
MIGLIANKNNDQQYLLRAGKITFLSNLAVVLIRNAHKIFTIHVITEITNRHTTFPNNWSVHSNQNCHRIVCSIILQEVLAVRYFKEYVSIVINNILKL